MEKQIELKNCKINYTLRESKKARRMLLAVYRDGAVVVTTPVGVKDNVAEKFIVEKTDWLFKKISHFNQPQNKSIIRYSRKDYLKNKDKALNLVKERITHFNKIYGCCFNRISIRNQKTRWGSCSRKGNLNFNYKIVLLPQRVSDYIIVHELCHLKELNHSSRFWDLVAKAIPNYLEVKKELKRNNISLR